MSRKKVVFFLSSYKIGLTSLLCEQACHMADETAKEFFFISGEMEQFPGLFARLDKKKLKYAKITGLDEHRKFFELVKEFKRYVDQFDPDAVHVQTNWQLAIAIAAKKLYRKEYSIIYTINGYRHNHQLSSIVARYLIGLSLYLFVDKIIMPSSFLKEKFSFLLERGKILFIGVDEEFFRKYRDPSFESTKRFIFPAEFRTGKNQDSIIRIIRKFIDRSGNDNVELYLPGKGESLDACKDLCKKLGLIDKVFFPGFIDRSQMLQYYLKCQFALIPSNIETFGQCIAEPYVLGRVVISKHVGVADDIIVHGKTGFLYDNEDELLEILINILSDIDTCRTVSRNTFHNRDIFNWKNITGQYFQLIDELPSR